MRPTPGAAPGRPGRPGAAARRQGGTREPLPAGPGGAAALRQDARSMSQCEESGAPRRRRCPAGSTAAATALGRRARPHWGAGARALGASEWCPAVSAAAGPWQQPYSGGMPGRKRRRGDTDSLAGLRGRGHGGYSGGVLRPMPGRRRLL